MMGMMMMIHMICEDDMYVHAMMMVMMIIITMIIFDENRHGEGDIC